MRNLQPGFYGYDDLLPGDHFVTNWAEITPEAIDNFASLTGDQFEIHLSDAGAATHGFPKRVAHGLLVLSLVEGLKSQAQVRLNTFAALGWEWSFHAPVFAGDRIRARVTVKSKRAAADKGLLILSVDVENQKIELVHRGETKAMAYRQLPNPKAV